MGKLRRDMLSLYFFREGGGTPFGIVWALAIMCLAETVMVLGLAGCQDKAPVKSEFVVFCSDRGGNFDVYTVSPAGSELTNLTNNPAEDYPAWVSKDGKEICFYSDREEWKSGCVRFPYTYVMDLRGKILRRFLGVGEFSPEWSPDFKSVIKLMADGAHIVRPVHGSSHRILGERAHYIGGTWSFSGKLLVLHIQKGEKHEVLITDMEGNVRHRLDNLGVVFGEAFLSPSETRLAYTAIEGGNYEVYIAEVNGTKRKNVSRNPAKDICSGWVVK